MFLRSLYKKGLLDIQQDWIVNNIIYEAIVGSRAYAIHSKNSDIDIIAITVPSREMVFPHINGYIEGFGTKPSKFEHYHKPHIIDGNTVYDIKIYSIVKFFDLCFRTNPDIIDSVFVPNRCIINQSSPFEKIHANRELFLSKQIKDKIRHYAYSNLVKLKSKTNFSDTKKHIIEKYGYDVKTASHIVRLMNKAEQILKYKTIDLEIDSEILKDIRCGKWSINQVEKYFYEKEKELEILYLKSTIQDKPDEKAIKELLMDCLRVSYKMSQDPSI